MALKLTITPSTNYIEDSINIKITGGTIPSNYKLEIWSYKTYPNPTGGIRIKSFDSNLSSDFNYTATYSDLNSTYYADKERIKIPVAFLLMKPTDPETYEVVSTSWKTLYIKPDPPTFDASPGYITVGSSNFAGNNFKIVRGLSKLQFANISGTAKKRATIKYFKVNNMLINYDSIIEHPDWLLDLSQTNIEPYLTFGLVDSRGFETNTQLATISRFTYSYQVPQITEMTVERDIASETTTLNVKGYYSEGYEVNKNPLTSGYEYTENVEGATTETGITSLTITKTPTSTFQDYLDILEEYNNPHYHSINNNQYYSEDYGPSRINEWTTYGIDQLFATAITYNNKYTQEYLENDYDSTNARYYCTSGGYNNNWNKFWEDTLNEIYKVMYGDNVYGTNIVGDEDGGNYKFEINATIQGDIAGGFSVDKTFYITSWILDSIKATTSDKRTEKTEFLSAAISAIDVYKDKVALHGLFDETISDSDIQFWGNTFLNGYNLQDIASITAYEGNIKLGKIGIEWGTVDVSPTTASGGNYYGSARVDFENTYKYSPGFFANAAMGATAINNVSTLNPSRTYGNVWMSSTNNTTRTCRYLVIGVLDDNE